MFDELFSAPCTGCATNNGGGVILTNLTHTGFNETTWSSSVKLTWSIHTPLISRFSHYRAKCLSTTAGQRNHHWKRIFESTQQEAFIHGLLQNTEYTCCIELYLNHDVCTDSCATTKLTSPSYTTTETTDTITTVPTEPAQTELQGSTTYREEEVAGLYVVIGLLCVLLAVSVLGWLVTGLVAYWKMTIYR